MDSSLRVTFSIRNFILAFNRTYIYTFTKMRIY